MENKKGWNRCANCHKDYELDKGENEMVCSYDCNIGLFEKLFGEKEIPKSEHWICSNGCQELRSKSDLNIICGVCEKRFYRKGTKKYETIKYICAYCKKTAWRPRTLKMTLCLDCEQLNKRGVIN